MANSIKELLLADLSVLILVCLFHDVLHNFDGKFQSHLFNLLMKFFLSNLSTTVLVEVFEDIVQVVLPAAVVIRKHRSNELIEVYLPVFVHIDTLQGGVKLLMSWIDSLLFQDPLDLIHRQIAIVIGINVFEELT